MGRTWKQNVDENKADEAIKALFFSPEGRDELRRSKKGSRYVKGESINGKPGQIGIYFEEPESIAPGAA